MAILNRSKDASEQKEVINAALGAVATGSTKQVLIVPYPCTIQPQVKVAATGVSNAMQIAFQVNRFIAGTGATAINLGISNVVLQNVGTSGPLGFSGLAAVGSTLLNLAANDVLQVVSSVASGNATDLVIDLVIKKTQEIVSVYGSSS